MKIGGLASSALYQMQAGSVKIDGVDTPSATGFKRLAKELDASQRQGADLIKAMEQSVNPNLGSHIDTYA